MKAPLAMVAWVCVWMGGEAVQCELSDADLAKIAAAGKHHLERERYSVAVRGLDGLPFDFRFAPANYTTAGVNPSSRYVVPRLGPWREGDLGGDSFLNWGIGEVTPLTTRQALVVLMCTPPPVRMWSLEAAILYRLNLTESIHHNVSLEAGASISNTENSATIASAKENKPLLVIMTPDQNTEAAIRGVFETVAPGMQVATIGINGTSSLLNFGTRPLAEGCDIFQLCMRVHASPSQTASPAYHDYLERHFPLLMVEPSFHAADAPLYPIADRAMRHGSTTEVALEQRRSVLQERLVKYMMAAGLRLQTRVAFTPVEVNKRRCLLDGKYAPYRVSDGCFGTSSDGRYTLSDPYTLPQKNMSSLLLVVIGANHVATGNAADNQLLYEKTVVVNPEGLRGSAEFFLGSVATKDDAGLFAYAFAEQCTAVLTGEFCSIVGRQHAGAAGPLLRVEAYLDEKSGTRPSMGLVHPVALLFTAD
jgi:hypothetical protein